jgi:hypothetical protein
LYDASTRRKTATSASMTTNNGSAPRGPPAFVAEHARKLGRATSSATAPQTHQAGAASPSSLHQPQSSIVGSPLTVTSAISASSFGNFFKIEQENGTEATGGAAAAGGASSLALPHSALSATDAGPVLLTSPQHYQYVYEAGGQSDANNHLSMPAPLSSDSGSGNNGHGARGRTNNTGGGAESEGHSVSSQVLPPPTTRSSLSQSSSSGGTNASIPVGGSGSYMPGPGAAIGASTHSSGAVVTTAVALGKHRVNIHHAAPGSPSPRR